MMKPLISVKDLSIDFRSDDGLVHAVKKVSFDLPRGRTVAVVGESGSGKSVISKAILGILPKNAQVAGGEIWFDDPKKDGGPVDLLTFGQDDKERRAIRGSRISIIFQEPMSSLSPLHTIGDQISEAVLLHRDVAAKEARELSIEMLRAVGFPDPKAGFDRYAFELSGGLRQRAMIAMALVCHPALLIADEPTTALDVTIQAQILKLIADLQEQLDMTILFITHDLGVVANIATDMVVMRMGRVLERGPCLDLLRDPHHSYLRALIDAAPRLTSPPDIRLRSIQDAADAPPPVAATPIDPADKVLEASNLKKWFQVRRSKGGGERVVAAVDDVSFDVARGETYAIVGESGSGKTTAVKMALRAIEPDEGAITFHDREKGAIDVRALDERGLRELRKKIQYVFQDPFGSLNPRMSVLEIIAEPLDIHTDLSRAQRADKVADLLEMVGLDRRAMQRYPHSFSGGQRQRIGIARALALDPEILICDEPVSALDVSVQAQILNLLKDLQAERGLSYVFISHNMAVVKYVAHRIAVMCRGRVVEIAGNPQLFESPQHPYTRSLLRSIPEPDESALLNFAEIGKGPIGEPSAWPAPFTLDAGAGDAGSGRLTEIAGGHFVRTQ